MIQPDAADIAELLGLPESATELPSCCPFSAIQALKIAVNDCDLLARGLPARMLCRQKGQFDEGESQRLYRIARAWLVARRVFKDDDRARRFLDRPHHMLNGERPIQKAADSSSGIQNLEELLGRLYYGSAA